MRSKQGSGNPPRAGFEIHVSYCRWAGAVELRSDVSTYANREHLGRFDLNVMDYHAANMEAAAGRLGAGQCLDLPQD